MRGSQTNLPELRSQRRERHHSIQPVIRSVSILLVGTFSHKSSQTLRELQAEKDSLTNEVEQLKKVIATRAPVKVARKRRKRERYAPKTDEEVALANLAHWFTMFGYLDVSRQMFSMLFKIHHGGEESEDDGADEGDEDGGKVERAPGYDGFDADDSDDDSDEDQVVINMVQEQEKIAVELLYELLDQNDLLRELNDKSKFMNQVRLPIAFLVTKTHVIFIHTL